MVFASDRDYPGNNYCLHVRTDASLGDLPVFYVIGSGVLSGCALTLLGKYSYGAYVNHGILRPAFVKRSGGLLVPIVGVIRLLHMLVHICAASLLRLILALLSFHLIEASFLSVKRFLQYSSRGAQTDFV